MGIRESLDQLDEKDLNLKNFTIQEDEPEQELEFDVEKEISERDWREMKKELEWYRKSKNWYRFATLAMCMSNLKPDKKAELHIDDSWQEMLDELEIDGTIMYRGLASSMAILRPEKREELVFDEMWQIEKKEMKTKKMETMVNSIKAEDPIDFIYSAYNLLVIQPQKKEELELDDKVWQKMKIVLNEKRNIFLGSFIELAMRTFVFWPDRKNELNIDHEAWKEMKNELKKRRNVLDKTLLGFAELAMSMYILSADRVKITDQGLELEMPEKESHQQKIPPRPERRQN